MKLKNLTTYAAAIAASLIGAHQASADFGVTLRTTSTDTSNTASTRLFNVGAPAGPGVDASELSDPLWLIFDVDGDGIFQSGALSGSVQSDGTQAGVRNSLFDLDDYVVFSVVNPTGAGVEGRTSQNILNLPSFLQTGGAAGNDAGGTLAATYAILFDDADFGNGGSFGYDQTTSTAIPSIGNSDVRIAQNVYADSFSFAVVPEPSTGLLAGIGLGLLALYRVRSRKS